MKSIFRLLAIVAVITLGIATFSCTSSPAGTYVEYPNTDRRITRTYVLNENGSATVTFNGIDALNRISTDTEYGYWENGNGYIKVVYDDGYYHAYIDLNENMVYHGLKYYRSRQGGTECKKIN